MRSDKPGRTPERRAHPRVRREVELHGAPSEGGTAGRMVTSDLSLGGLHCVSTHDYPEMTRLAVRLMLPATDDDRGSATVHVDLEAVVVRRQAYRSADGTPRFELALFFPNLQGAARQRISNFLGYTNGKPPKPRT